MRLPLSPYRRAASRDRSGPAISLPTRPGQSHDFHLNLSGRLLHLKCGLPGSTVYDLSTGRHIYSSIKVNRRSYGAISICTAYPTKGVQHKQIFPMLSELCFTARPAPAGWQSSDLLSLFKPKGESFDFGRFERLRKLPGATS
jgi:hypothetical protein